MRLASGFVRWRKRALVFLALSLLSSGLFFLIGLFWPDLMTMP